MYSWKPSFEALETRDVPAVLGLIGHMVPNVVYPPSDPTILPPPPPPTPPPGGELVIVLPPAQPTLP